MSWQKKIFFEVLSSLILHNKTNHFSTGLRVLRKVGFIWQLVTTSSVVRLTGRSKALCEVKLAPKNVFGGLLPVWSTTAFWIPLKPVHLRSMLSKLMRCTENCNACSRHWPIEWAQFSTQHLTTCHATSALKVEQIRLWNFVPSAIFTWPLTNWLPLF